VLGTGGGAFPNEPESDTKWGGSLIGSMGMAEWTVGVFWGGGKGSENGPVSAPPSGSGRMRMPEPGRTARIKCGLLNHWSATNRGESMANKIRQMAFLTAGLLLTNAPEAEAARALLTDDTYISSNISYRHYNFNSASNICVDSRPVMQHRGFLRFDIRPALPPDATAECLTKATLSLNVFILNLPGTVNVLAVNGFWTEGTLRGLNPPAVLNSPQTNQPYATSRIEMPRTWVSFDVTELVRDWMDGTLPNHGLALVPGEQGVGVSFSSREPGQLRVPAELELVYTPAPQAGPPGPAGPAGKQGVPGPQGLAGLNGLAGLPGPVGATGPAGPAGEQGLRGERGESGPAGPPGAPTPEGTVAPVYRIRPRGDISMGAFTQGEKP
jgi:hypothetical protein